MELFKLLGTIAVDNSEANKNIDSTTGKVSNFSSKMKTGITTAGKLGTAVVGASAVAVGGLTKFATSSAAVADNIDKMSQKIGISRTAYQELDFICSQSGTSVDSLQAGMKTMTAAMDGAASGTASNIEQFAALGVSVTNADGSLRSQEEVMWETLAALQGVENQTEKARLATELFGKSGTELMPLLNGASGSIDEMRQQANDLGLVMNDEFIDNGVNLTDSLDQTKRAFGAVVTQLGGSLMPIVEQASDFIQASLPSIQALIQKLAPIITSLFNKLLPPLMQLMEEIFPVLVDLFAALIPPIASIVEQLLPVIVDLLKKLLPPIVKIIEKLLPPLIELITALLPIVEPLLNLVLALLTPLLKLVNKILPPLITVITAVVDVLVDILSPAIEFIAGIVDTVFNAAIKTIEPIMKAVWEYIKKAWEGIKNIFIGAFNVIKNVFAPLAKFFEGIWDGIKKAFSNVTDWFKNVFSSAWQAVKNVFSTGGKIFDGIKDGIASVFKTVVNGIIGGINKVIAVPFKAINGMLSTLKGIEILGVEPFGWVKTFSVPEIPKLYRGGVLEKGQTGYLEGDGAEAVVPLDQNKAWISKVAADMDAASGNNETLQKILELLQNIFETLPDAMVDAIVEGTRFEVNNREFARMVKAVN